MTNEIKYYGDIILGCAIVVLFVPYLFATGKLPACKCGCRLSTKAVRDLKHAVNKEGRNGIVKAIKQYDAMNNLYQLEAFFTNHCRDHIDTFRKYLLLI